MPTMTADKIGFFLSGGSSNADPSLSLGGGPSTYIVTSLANGLFEDASVATALSGLVDYRCIYVFNESKDSTLYGASVHIESSDSGDSFLTLGALRRDESQVFSVGGTVFFGRVNFSFEGEGFSASWSGSPDSFAKDMQSELSLLGLDGVEVTHSYLGSSHKFTIVFGGSIGNRSQPLVKIEENLLEGIGRPSVSLERQTAGSPINTTAQEIATPEVPPFGVDFMNTSSSSRMLIGDLGPGESMPIWIRRTTPAGASSKEGARSTIRVSGTS